MKLRIMLPLFFIFSLFLFSSASAATCGDSICDAGQYLQGKGVEDASTCYRDCAFIDYSVCHVSKANGGICNFGGVDYYVTNITTSGCADSQINDISVTFLGQERDINGFLSQKWIQLQGNVEFLFSLEPCFSYVTQSRIYFRRGVTPQSLNDFVYPEKTVLNLKNDKNIELVYNFPTNVSLPYCKTTVIDTQTGQEVNHLYVAGCSNNRFEYQTAGLNPGKYAVVSQYFDVLAQNKLGENTTIILLNGCETNTDCSDSKNYTQDTCIAQGEVNVCQNTIINQCEKDSDCPNKDFFSINTCKLQGEVKVCKGEQNSILIYSVIGGLVLIIIIVVLIFALKIGRTKPAQSM